MRVYLAAAWSRQAEVRLYANVLRAEGIEVTSRWLEEREAIDPRDRERHRRETALIDIQDVRAADALVRFTDDLSQPTVPSGLATGARMFEMGLAWAEGIPVVVVGGRQQVFDFLPNVVHLKDFTELVNFLSPREPE